MVITFLWQSFCPVLVCALHSCVCSSTHVETCCCSLCHLLCLTDWCHDLPKPPEKNSNAAGFKRTAMDLACNWHHACSSLGAVPLSAIVVLVCQRYLQAVIVLTLPLSFCVVAWCTLGSCSKQLEVSLDEAINNANISLPCVHDVRTHQTARACTRHIGLDTIKCNFMHLARTELQPACNCKQQKEKRNL